jgi:hypothetical protein
MKANKPIQNNAIRTSVPLAADDEAGPNIYNNICPIVKEIRIAATNPVTAISTFTTNLFNKYRSILVTAEQHVQYTERTGYHPGHQSQTDRQSRGR